MLSFTHSFSCHAAVRGTADLGATVLVNGAPAVQEPPFFYGSVWLDNTLAAILQPLEITAVLPAGDAPGPDLVSTETGSLFVPKTLEQFTYDLDGNLTSDGRFTYTWNAEIKRAQSPSPRRRAAAILRLARDVTSARARSGIPRRSGNCHRLTRAETLPGLPPEVPRLRIDYAYDHQGRMVSKRVSDVTRNSQLETRNYIWDYWNIISESFCDSELVTSNSFYVWGLDLSGSLQGAGGVGGLLAVIRDDGVFAPTYDANGNVSEYVVLVTSNSELVTAPIVAHYEYDAFGNTVVKSGPMADDFAFRFSTKPYCAITGISHYQLRDYSPSLGMRMSRDPIVEEAFLRVFALFIKSMDGQIMNPAETNTNPYLFVNNNPNRFDSLGLVQYLQINCTILYKLKTGRWGTEPNCMWNCSCPSGWSPSIEQRTAPCNQQQTKLCYRLDSTDFLVLGGCAVLVAIDGPLPFGDFLAGLMGIGRFAPIFAR